LWYSRVAAVEHVTCCFRCPACKYTTLIQLTHAQTPLDPSCICLHCCSNNVYTWYTPCTDWLPRSSCARTLHLLRVFDTCCMHRSRGFPLPYQHMTCVWGRFKGTLVNANKPTCCKGSWVCLGRCSSCSAWAQPSHLIKTTQSNRQLWCNQVGQLDSREFGTQV
jgi:hypothetical protein